jgi:cob(I)alamin adenosyltransferase
MVETLSALYPKREAQQIISYIFEDLFNLQKPYSTVKQFNIEESEELRAIRTSKLSTSKKLELKKAFDKKVETLEQSVLQKKEKKGQQYQK